MKTIYQKNVEQFGFSNAQKIILSKINSDLEVLEVGSSSGYLTRELTQKGVVVDIVEVEKEPFYKASKYSRSSFLGSIEDPNLQKKIVSKYDVIICADVLEHLAWPDKVLDFLRTKLKKDGQMLISIPNVAYWGMRVHLLFEGDFAYQDSGLLDRTHLRFYSLNNFTKLLEGCGYKIIKIYPAETRVPFELSLQKIPFLGNLVIFILKSFFVKFYPNLSLYHYVVKASL